MNERDTWREAIEELNSQAVADLDAAIDEIIRLQERVRTLERVQMYPDNAFWGQLMFDVFVFIFAIFVIIKVV